MNPILQDVMAFISDQRRFTRFEPEKRAGGKRGVVFHFVRGQPERREYGCDDRTFLAWWGETESHIRETHAALQEAMRRI